MPLPPKVEDFRLPRTLEAGFDYVWTTGEMHFTEFQNQGYIFTNQFADSQGQRYQLMTKGRKERAVSSDNVAPRIRVIYPDAWDVKYSSDHTSDLPIKEGSREEETSAGVPQQVVEDRPTALPSFDLDDLPTTTTEEASNGEEEG